MVSYHFYQSNLSFTWTYDSEWIEFRINLRTAACCLQTREMLRSLEVLVNDLFSYPVVPAKHHCVSEDFG